MQRKGPSVIFDMDGVIVDSKPFHRQAWQSFCAEARHQMSDEDFEAVFGRRSQDVIRSIFGTHFSKEEVEAFGKEIDRRFRSLVVGHIEPVSGLKEFMASLSRGRIPMGLATSGSLKNVELILGTLHLYDSFAAIIAEEDVARGKPDPEIFLMAATRLGCIPKRCVVFEDSINGIIAAKRAGMKCVALTTTHKREELTAADLVIKDFSEIDFVRLAAIA
jgi:HAD superfamily hydrolase (TIGR01549 family)